MNHNESLQKLLANALSPLGFELLIEPLENYLLLLNRWNTTHNLTAIKSHEEMIQKHILDSLAIAPWVRGDHALDVGTGAGLPGIPLALALPDTQWVLLDATHKKTVFLEEVKRQLGLKNVNIVNSRAENYHLSTGFDTLTSRAFSQLKTMIKCTQHLIAHQGIWLAMKGVFPEAELKEITQSYEVHPYSIPGAQERCCVVINNK